MNIYRNIGRVLGMALLMGEIFPLPLIRPVFKYILGRELRWHDLAFFDHTTYESLRQLLELASTPAGYATIESCALTFSFHPSLEEGGGSGSVVRELVDGGAHIAVTAQNIRLYVQLYAKARMRDIIIGPLENLRKGVFDVITPQSMEGLTAEDIRLILNGQSEIDIDQLILCTLFVDESGIRPSKPERISKIRLWFWNVVRSMDQSQRQDLVYFWTSSPTLPSSGNSFSPSPSITVRPPDDNRLPSANTCVYRIYLPYYSSRSILKERLLEAIRVKDFGFV
jgi:E3 ubiquitin-protein ligase EDD1